MKHQQVRKYHFDVTGLIGERWKLNISQATLRWKKVNVDYWAMGKAMLTYGAMTVLGWVMLKLFTAVFTLPRRLRLQQDNIQQTLQELQKRFPDMNITEEDLKNAEKEMEELLKEEEEKRQEPKDSEEKKVTDKAIENSASEEECKKTI